MLFFLLIFLLGCIVAVIFSFNALYNTLKHGLPFVSSPKWAIEWLSDNLQLIPPPSGIPPKAVTTYNLKPTTYNTVFELGCGDARVLSAIAKKHQTAQFVGIEIQWWPYILAKIRTRQQKNIKIIYGNIFDQDFSPATVVYGFFIAGFMQKLETKLISNLKPGTTIISYGFRFPNLITTEEIPNTKNPKGSRILVYRR